MPGHISHAIRSTLCLKLKSAQYLYDAILCSSDILVSPFLFLTGFDEMPWADRCSLPDFQHAFISPSVVASLTLGSLFISMDSPSSCRIQASVAFTKSLFLDIHLHYSTFPLLARMRNSDILLPPICPIIYDLTVFKRWVNRLTLKGSIGSLLRIGSLGLM